jgi:Ca2+-binding RTX toxin-like protein
VKGGQGPDHVYGGPGNDVVWTGKGGAHDGDAAYGGRGNDRLYNFGSGQTAGMTHGGPGFDRCTVNQHDVDAGLVSCEVVIIR